jgi:hypothetical protein
MLALFYIAGKLLAYSLWCLLGLRKVRRDSSAPLSRALAFGFVRLFMGLFFGVVIWLASSWMLSAFGYGLPQNVLTYLLVYVPVRWIEWSIMAAFILPNPSSFAAWLIGASPTDRYWRLGGIVISCLADIPLIIGFGGVIPTGRFMC